MIRNCVRKLTFNSLADWSPTSRTNSTTKFLKIYMAIPIHIQGLEEPLAGRGRHRGRHQLADALQIQLAGRRRRLKQPETLLQVANVPLLQVSHSRERLVERGDVQNRGQQGDTRFGEQPP